jgi:hypothetical protein
MATNNPKAGPKNNPKNAANKSTRPTTAPTESGTFDPHEDEYSKFSVAGIRAHTLNHYSVKMIMFLLIIIFAVGFLITSFNPTAGLGGGHGVDPQARFTSTEAVA